MSAPDAQASEGAVGEVAALSAVRTAKLIMSDDIVSLAPEGWRIIVNALNAAEAALTAHEQSPVDPLRMIACEVALQVSELPDRTSPDNWPDAMLVTGDELQTIVEDVLRARLPAAAVAAVEWE